MFLLQEHRFKKQVAFSVVLVIVPAVTNVPVSKFVVIWHNVIRFFPVFGNRTPQCHVGGGSREPEEDGCVRVTYDRADVRDVCDTIGIHFGICLFSLPISYTGCSESPIFEARAATSPPLLSAYPGWDQSGARKRGFLLHNRRQFWILIAHRSGGETTEDDGPSEIFSDKAAKIPRCDLFPLPRCNRFTGTSVLWHRSGVSLALGGYASRRDREGC